MSIRIDWNMIDKTELLDEVVNEIDDYTTLVAVVRQLYDSVTIRQQSSPFINYRDSLFHYKRMYEANNASEFLEQYFSIKEHLNRGIKDSMIFFLHIVMKRIELKSSNVGYIHPTQEEKIRVYLHKLKDVSLNIRIGSLHINRILGHTKEIVIELFNVLEDMKKSNLHTVVKIPIEVSFPARKSNI